MNDCCKRKRSSGFDDPKSSSQPCAEIISISMKKSRTTDDLSSLGLLQIEQKKKKNLYCALSEFDLVLKLENFHLLDPAPILKSKRLLDHNEIITSTFSNENIDDYYIGDIIDFEDESNAINSINTYQ